MLHDLYLLSRYFEPAQAILYEDELRMRYGDDVIRDAAGKGFLEFHCVPCSKGDRRLFCRLSALGMGYVEHLAA